MARKLREGGREFALLIIEQKSEDFRKMEEETYTGETREVLVDMNADALRNPVLRAMRAQARNGVGNSGDQLPATTINALLDRAYGKVADRVKMEDVTKRPYGEMSDEELAIELAKASRELGERPPDPDTAN